MTNPRRVVVTGLGWVTSMGLSVDKVWQRLLDGESGITTITRFDTDGFGTTFAGEVAEWDGGPKVDPRTAKRLDRFAQFAVNASVDAVEDSGIDFTKEDRWRCGAIIGSGVGGMDEFCAGVRKLDSKGPGRVSPFLVPKLMCNAAAGNVSIRFRLCGPNTAIATACASGAHAIGEAGQAIRQGVADVMLAGGSEAALSPIGLASFIALKALSSRNGDPAGASRPFDKERDGFILAEGAGIVVLEEYEHAKARGANIYAELLGYGQSADGFHITAPDEQGAGAAHAMAVALDDCKRSPADVDYINAHATSTHLGDLAEIRAVKGLFGKDAYNTMMSATKSMTGHLLGASGGVEAIIVAKAIKHGKIPPTINLTEPDEECDMDFVADGARDADISVAMSNSFGFGGHNVSLVFGKV